ncbi:hypothetical protein GAYE_SCF64G6739 [Galdieria yellowstonensis]|uniref:SAP domain-containing protein n=1 Tax=Galdieria yellowstonensis TaxID=3028027 RepID=A0AAV9INC0_9RHOD|nr:hypothetical protein GAYE_SCF64G6739 [Galdieria yellowstonensis]
MSSCHKQPTETPCNLDINTAAELLTSLQHGRKEGTPCDIQQGNRKEQENHGEYYDDTDEEELSNKTHQDVKKQGSSPTSHKKCSSSKGVEPNGPTDAAKRWSSQPGKPLVFTPIQKRTRPSSGFENSNPSCISRRPHRVHNMFSLEWVFLQQLKWYQLNGVYPIPFRSPVTPWTANTNSNSTCTETDHKALSKTCKGRPRSELPLSRMRYKALQQACVDRGISPHGTVAALKQRLRDWVSIKMTGKPSVPQQKRRRIENAHPAVQDYKAIS